MTPHTRKWIWAFWGLGSAALAIYFGLRLAGPDRTVFLPGATSNGHHQIEIACDACHGDSFTSADALQEKCEGCHADALAAARDAHPQSKFTDPRNAERTALLDARYCVTCHAEHEPAITDAVGVTLPGDFCALCHQDIGTERPSHAPLGFETCASSGCHNFHDNRALYENFLLRHADQPALLTNAEVPARNLASIAALIDGYPDERFPLTPLSAREHDAPPDVAAPAAIADWAASAHADAGVNCTACHTSEADPATWISRPDHSSCRGCHATEVEGFMLGRHGMRLDAATLGVTLTPMQPRLARLPMTPDTAERELDCGACHSAHRYDTEHAAVGACLECHADEHSRAYTTSPHVASGVTCATCHLPRVPTDRDYGAYMHVLVEHNQSDNLRPNDKMLRPVCMQCHGLGFSIDALADRALIKNNFAAAPRIHVPSIDLAVERRRAIDLERQAQSAGRADIPVQP